MSPLCSATHSSGQRGYPIGMQLVHAGSVADASANASVDLRRRRRAGVRDLAANPLRPEGQGDRAVQLMGEAPLKEPRAETGAGGGRDRRAAFFDPEERQVVARN